MGAPLPGTAEPTERADAARNRQLLLDAAQQLVREHDVDSLTMDALAKRAGVGKGTVFRRFGNRSGLLLALLDHSERKFQHAFMFGPPPLGPGALNSARVYDYLLGGKDYREVDQDMGNEMLTRAPEIKTVAWFARS
ncbi:TetR/AcrR family transcriptional regulator, partial [Nocardia brasiliensis]|uniref:TetR/AcrR family transcriptional regulator n=1 Tax=Nocardia brasiliensis TaxID=37326 RepID=UPI002454DE01